MRKTKKAPNPIWQYLREVSVVVIGVAITLFASYLITNKNERKDMSLYLHAIKLELEENIKFLDSEVEYLEDWEKYALYLSSRDKNSVHKDSIRGWNYEGIGSTHNIAFQTSAFEMFKVSGAMRLMNNKELLQNVWKAYLDLEKIKMTLDSYYQLKSEELKKNNQIELAKLPNPIPMYDFYHTYVGFGALEGCKSLSKELKAIVGKL